jgi:acyl-CoA synthetase (NDP forming)
MNLQALFHPTSIALVGATDKSRWSWSTWANLSGFTGPVYCVNPRSETVHKQPAYKSVSDLPQPADQVYVMVPTDAVLPVLREAAAQGTRSAVVLTAGFGEVGEEGRRKEAELIAFARESGMVVLGPNGNGFINLTAGITPYGLPVPDVRTGSVGFVLQSGALASAVLTFAAARDVGVSRLVSMGNEAIVSLTDVVDHLVDDPATTVIALFIEQVRAPAEFARVARRALRAGKPLVALKAGRSEVGARVAIAHTGALTGDDAVTDAAFRQLGVVRVGSIEDLTITAGLLADMGGGPEGQGGGKGTWPVSGRRAGFVTASGGACEIIADRAEEEGIELPPYAPATAAALTEICPPFATVQNPLDVTGYVVVDPGLLRNAAEAAADDPGTDLTVVMIEPPRSEPRGGPEKAIQRLSALAEVRRQASQPMVFMTHTVADITPYTRTLLDDAGFPYLLGGVEHGLTALGNVIRWSEHHRRELLRGARAPVMNRKITAEGGDALEVVASAGIPVVPTERADSADEAVAAALRLGLPVAVKAGEQVAHKSDVGGVRLGLRTVEDVRHAYESVAEAAASPGCVVQAMRSGGVELLVGVVRDPAWGPTLAIGLGGVWVELLKDVALRVLPVDREDVSEMLGELRGAGLLDGARGAGPVDRDRLVDVIERFAALVDVLGDRVQSLEINPLWADGGRIEALDALVTWPD